MSQHCGPHNGLFVWDASSLHHVGKAGRLDVLGSYVAGPVSDRWQHCVTDIVAGELGKYGLDPPPWCEVVSATDLPDVIAFAQWSTLMSDGIHDVGEASVAAWAQTRGLVAIIDDRDAKSVAVAHGCHAHGSLWLLCRCIKKGMVDVVSASTLADAALDAGARWPFERHGFRQWATGAGLLDP